VIVEKIKKKDIEVLLPLLVLVLTLYVALNLGLLTGFPKGTDAYAHLTKIKYIINNWPNFHWNYQWDSGVPLFGGSYPPLGYYLVVGLKVITGWSIPFTLIFLSISSYCLFSVSLYYFLKYQTGNNYVSFLCILLLVLSPAFWSQWGLGGAYGRVMALGFLGLALYLITKEPGLGARALAVNTEKGMSHGRE